jgi:radical SAM superfamily enzyme YgiQ (UPF0313 family)
MLLATLPQRYARWMGTDWSTEVEVNPDGSARYVPNGLRVVESLLLERYPASDVVVCYPDQLDLFVGDQTRVIGIHAHNPLGITFATDVYAGLYGANCEPINAHEFRRIVEHPAIAQHRQHLKVIAGGPGVWQIEHQGLQAAWGIDTLVHGEAEEVVQRLFARAMSGEPLPERVDCESPLLESIPVTRNRSTFGVVEITRGCGRGCQFCSVALRDGKSLPLEHILANVRNNVAQGADTITLTTEDLFLYEQGKHFSTNAGALERLFRSVADVPGVEHIMLSHGSMAPVVVDPPLLERLHLAVDKSVNRHPASTHRDNRYAMMFVGLETGSVRLFKQYMPGKCYPYRPEQWPDVVLKGMEIMNRHNWFPMATFIIGLPGETAQDTKESLELLHALKDAKWCVIPTLFVPLEETRMASRQGAQIARLTDLQWEFFFTCWRYNIDFFRRQRSVQWKFNLGIPLYYYTLGRRLFGPAMKYPLLRLAHFPERLMRGKLHLNFSRPLPPREVALPEITRPHVLAAAAGVELHGIAALGNAGARNGGAGEHHTAPHMPGD